MSTSNAPEQEGQTGNLLSRVLGRMRKLGGTSESTQIKPKSPLEKIADIRTQLGQDGHLVENIAAMIVSESAAARSLSGNVVDASFNTMDAFAGKDNNASLHTDRLSMLAVALENPEIQRAAFDIGLASSEKQRKALVDARGQGFPALRQVALRMRIPTSQGEASITLGDKIRAVIPQTPKA